MLSKIDSFCAPLFDIEKGRQETKDNFAMTNPMPMDSLVPKSKVQKPPSKINVLDAANDSGPGN